MSLPRVLARPAFRGLLLGQLVSIAGDRFNYLALVALLSAHAAARGESPAFLLSLLAWAMLGPSLLLSPWAGAVVDRLPLVRVLLVTDSARALVVAAMPLALAATGSLVPVFALVALAFALNCFFLPARSALPPHLVPAGTWSSANALLVLSGIVATVLGTALGGPLVDRFGPPTALYLDALTYGVSVLCLWTILVAGAEVRPPADAAPAVAAGRAGKADQVGPRTLARRAALDAAHGWQLLAREPGARWPVLAAIATWIAGGALHVAGTAHVQRGRTEVTGLGLLLAALALGATLGSALTLARERRAVAAGGVAAATGVATARGSDRVFALGFGLLGAGVGLFGFALSETLLPMALAGFAVGAFAAPVFFLSETAIQEAVPGGARARVFSVRDFLARGAFLLTTAITAPLVTARGPAAALLIAALFLVVLGLVAVTVARGRLLTVGP